MTTHTMSLLKIWCFHTPRLALYPARPNHPCPLPPQVSIVPRGSAALGFAQYLPNENMLMTTEQVGWAVWAWCGQQQLEGLTRRGTQR